jgi:peroxin-19
MQEAGAPPPELIGDTNGASELMGDMDAGCPQQ